MKRNLTKTLALTLLGLAASTAAEARNFLDVTNGATMIPGKKYAVGSYIHIGSGIFPSTGGYLYVRPGSYLDGSSGANQNSTVITEVNVTRAVTNSQINMIQARISEVHGDAPAGQHTSNTLNLLGGETAGGNAGSAKKGFGVWAKASYDHLRDRTFMASWRGDLLGFVLGADYEFWNKKIVGGLAAAYSHLDGHVDFNNGEISDNSYGVMPYASIRALSWLNVDIMGSYSHVDKDRSRQAIGGNVNSAGGPVGPRITSSPDSDRYAAAIFANANRMFFQHVNLSGRLGVSHAADHQGRFTESDGTVVDGFTHRITQGNARVQVGYKASAVEPYMFGVYSYDLEKTNRHPNLKDTIFSAATGTTVDRINNFVAPTSGRSRHTAGGGFGMNIVANKCWSGGLEASYTQNKKWTDYGVFARIRYVF